VRDDHGNATLARRHVPQQAKNNLMADAEIAVGSSNQHQTRPLRGVGQGS
jgi:hypothetical protein